MRVLSAFLLCLLVSPLALSQNKPALQLKGELDFGDTQERIVAYKFLDGENRLLLVGRKTIRLLDVLNAKFLESRPIEIPEFTEDRPRVIRPDGRRMLVFGNYGSKDKKDKVKRPASIWDLQTGKQIALLDKTSKPVRAGVWSKNGKTLATSSDENAPLAISTSVEISFWDGETFQLQNSLPSDKVNWWYLTDDGEKCFFSIGPVKNLLILKYLNPAGGPISVWDTRRGQMDKTIPASTNNPESKLGGMNISPDERVLAFVVQPQKSDKERRLAVWGIGKSNPAYEIKPKYEIKPNPKLYEYGVSFSPDGKYFALDVGKNLQIYETEAGEKRFELPNLDAYPSYWLNDNKILLYNYGNKLEAFEAASGKPLYQQKLIYVVSESTNTEEISGVRYNTPMSEMLDRTTIAVHPNRNLFLTYSRQYVKVFDSLTGELLQTLVSPPMDDSKKKPRLSDKPLVSKAGWSHDGKTLYIINAEEKSISLWELLGN